MLQCGPINSSLVVKYSKMMGTFSEEEENGDSLEIALRAESAG